MHYELVRSKRKTLALSLDRDGRLTVRAPLRLPLGQIDAFVREKWPWVEKTRSKLSALPPPMPKLTLTDGATFPYRGQTLTLRLADVKRVTREDQTLLVPRGATNLAPVLRWVEGTARAVFAEQVDALAQRLSLRPATLRLSRAKGRWGSMSSRGTLSLNLALILCPPETLTYVIVHELCHIPHPNHSNQFWAAVERCLPDYRAQRAWLKAHQSLISLLPDQP